jgi:2-phosphosulfolactate phosphatase
MIFDQSDYNIRCEWGEKGIALLAPISDVVIVVDVLSFTTAVEIATAQGARVYPYRWRDGTVYEFAQSVAAQVADQNNPHGYCLSPASLQALPSDLRLVLPSPNGSHLSLSTGSTPTIAGCLRNCEAVAASALKRGLKIAVIPAGERWEDGTLRPSFEDWVGAGAIIHYLRGARSPEASLAAAAFESACPNLLDQLKRSGSGKEKIDRGEELDVALAAELNVSDCVPRLTSGVYKREA